MIGTSGMSPAGRGFSRLSPPVAVGASCGRDSGLAAGADTAAGEVLFVENVACSNHPATPPA